MNYASGAKAFSVLSVSSPTIQLIPVETTWTQYDKTDKHNMRRKKDLIIFVDGTARHTDEPMHLLFVDDRKFNLDESDVWNC